jgi:hypothetical protein
MAQKGRDGSATEQDRDVERQSGENFSPPVLLLPFASNRVFSRKSEKFYPAQSSE